MTDKGVDTLYEDDLICLYIVLGVPGRSSWWVLASYRFDPKHWINKAHTHASCVHMNTRVLVQSRGYVQSMMIMVILLYDV